MPCVTNSVSEHRLVKPALAPDDARAKRIQKLGSDQKTSRGSLVEANRGKAKEPKESDSSWEIKASESSLRTSNPIRKIVDSLQITNRPEKPLIPLSIGDPTVYGCFPISENIIETLSTRLREGTNNGYPPAVGLAKARVAIANKFSAPTAKLTKDDVVIASGCSGAIEMAFKVFASEGDNVLLPCPGFSLYQTVCEHLGVECRFYSLKPDNNWECNLSEMDSLIDERTRCILINNPSNPCGSVFSKQHLTNILTIAEKYKLPIISDEIYADMVFRGASFHALAPLTAEVPILTVGGLAKQYMVPGWRVGWILIHDRHNRFSEVRKGLARLATLVLGANSLIQSAIPEIFEKTPKSYYDAVNARLEEHATFLVDRLSSIAGLKVIVPQGAMYIMVEILFEHFKDVSSDVEFTQLLLDEESVFVLPGSCFRAPNFFRVVTCPPISKLEEACQRIERCCKKQVKDLN